ncbi:nitroreductase family protein [candidate division KSB1 bacterium]|nr:nitroreductase family protein [candidate division KSB1 bacterium]
MVLNASRIWSALWRRLNISTHPIIESIQKRRSIRRFDERPVPRDLILSCIEAVRLAPSAENVQPSRFIVIDDPERRDALSKAAFSGIYSHTQWAAKAPVLIAICAELDILANRIGKAIQNMPYYLIDIGIAGEHFVLQAESLGLGTCWIGWFDFRKAKKHLRIPRHIRLCELIAVGYPDGESRKSLRKRKDLEELVRFNQW